MVRIRMEKSLNKALLFFLSYYEEEMEMAKHLTNKQKKKIKDWYDRQPKKEQEFLLAEAIRMIRQSKIQEDLLKKESK